MAMKHTRGKVKATALVTKMIDALPHLVPLFNAVQSLIDNNAKSHVTGVNAQRAAERARIAGEALATAATLGVSGPTLAKYVNEYRESVSVFLKDLPQPEPSKIDIKLDDVLKPPAAPQAVPKPGHATVDDFLKSERNRRRREAAAAKKAMGATHPEAKKVDAVKPEAKKARTPLSSEPPTPIEAAQRFVKAMRAERRRSSDRRLREVVAAAKRVSALNPEAKKGDAVKPARRKR